MESWTELTPTWYPRPGLLGELAVLASLSCHLGTRNTDVLGLGKVLRKGKMTEEAAQTINDNERIATDGGMALLRDDWSFVYNNRPTYATSSQ